MQDTDNNTKLSPLQESLLLISSIKNLLGISTVAYKRNFQDSDIRFCLNHNIIVLVCNFLDEYRRYTSLAKDNHLIRKNARKLSLQIEKITKWKDLHKHYRNQIAAHYGRDNQGRFIDIRKNFKYNIPYQDAEILFLGELVRIIGTVILHIHWQTYEQSLEIHGNSYYPKAEYSEIKTLEEFESEMLSSIKEIKHQFPELDFLFSSYNPLHVY